MLEEEGVQQGDKEKQRKRALSDGWVAVAELWMSDLCMEQEAEQR